MREELAPGQVLDVSCVIDARTGERFVAAGPPNDCWLVTSPRVADAHEKLRLASTYSASLVDMEAAGVARLAQMRGIPFYCIKGISDGYNDQLPDFNRFISPDGQFQLARFVVFALLRPWHWPALIRMGENSRKAARSIAESLLDFLDERGRIRQRNGYPNFSTLKPGSRRKFPPPCAPSSIAASTIMRVETVPVPAIGPGELLVKIATCGVCGTDLKKIHTGSHSAPAHLRP